MPTVKPTGDPAARPEEHKGSVGLTEAAHLRRRILLPAGGMLLLVAICAAASLSWAMRARAREETLLLANKTKDGLAYMAKSESRCVAAALDRLETDPEVVHAWRARDQERLFALVYPLFARLNQYGFSGFYFFDTNRVSLLRVQDLKPSYPNDLTEGSRPTAIQAARTGQDAWGFDLGPRAHFAFRYVRPWRHDGALLGYMMSGMKGITPEDLAKRLGLTLHAGFLVLVRREHTTAEGYQARLRAAQTNGVIFPGFVVASRTLTNVPPDLGEKVENSRAGHSSGVFDLAADGRRWSCCVLPVIDAGGRPLAELVVMRDTLDDVVQQRRILGTLVVATLGVGGLLFLVLWVSTSRSEARLAVAIAAREREEEERRRAERALRQSKEELAAANEQLAAVSRAKSEFLAGMSHEIRTPMNAILGFTEVLAGKIQDRTMSDYLASIRAASRGLLQIVNDILDLSKIEAGRLELQAEAVDPRAVFADVRQVFAPVCVGKGLTFELDIAPDLPAALVLDEVRVRQVLFNLVSNAVKFTQKGGVVIRAAHRRIPDCDSHVQFTFGVSDTGVGIPSDQKDLIFRAFHQQPGQSTRQYGGTGLGLTISRRLVEMMGGRIELITEIGRGSEFRVLLEKIEVAATLPAASVAAEPGADIKFPPARVLVVDDVATNRSLLRAYLTGTALTIDEASNGLEAIESVKQHPPDLILLDLKMPVLDGFETVRRLKAVEAYRRIPILVVTASSAASPEERSKTIMCDGWLGKPLVRSELWREIGRLLPGTHIDASSDSPPLPFVWPEPPDDQTRGRWTELAKRLRSECESECALLRQRTYVNRTQSLAEHIICLSHEYRQPALLQWAEELQRLAANFDVEQLRNSLSQFSLLLDRLEGLVESSSKQDAGHVS